MVRNAQTDVPNSDQQQRDRRPAISSSADAWKSTQSDDAATAVAESERTRRKR